MGRKGGNKRNHKLEKMKEHKAERHAKKMAIQAKSRKGARRRRERAEPLSLFS